MEKTFQLTYEDVTVPCYLSAPEAGQIRRLVLGVHGLGGSANDAIQASIAEEMEFFSSASFRFDFPAHGESPMECEDFTLKNCRNALLTVARFAREQYPQVEDLCIFATGFGAYVTLVSLEELLELPGRVKLVVQTPSVRMDQTLLTMGRVSEATFRAMDLITFRTAPRRLEVRYSLYEELRDNIALTDFSIPILILHGEEDAYIRMEDIQNFRRMNEQAKLVIIPGTSHRFLEDGAWDMVLDLTRDWFEFEQVLLTDWE